MSVLCLRSPKRFAVNSNPIILGYSKPDLSRLAVNQHTPRFNPLFHGAAAAKPLRGQDFL